MTDKLIRTAAWLAAIAIVFVTVSPIGLRPHDVLPVNVDRALAFTAMAALFVLAYPRQWMWVAMAAIVGAGAIELLQELSPTRHARIDDAMVKIAGASIGVVIGWTINQTRARGAA
ncbi:MAG: putative rane protein [Rhizobium sp.]|nr:putative rane protein [Rhizobium sp.]